MTHPQILCLGEVLFDCLAEQTGRELEQVESWTPYPGGAPANVACALVKLGTAAGFIGCVGEDEAGNSLVQLLQDVGVNTAGIQRHPTAPTRQVYVLRSEAGDRSFAGFGERDTTEFADAYLQADRLPVDLFQQANFLVLGTLELAYPETRQAIAKAIDLAKQHNVKILVDVNWRPMFWPNVEGALEPIQGLIKQADFLKLSDEEAKLLFASADPSAIASQLNSVAGILITAGEQGCHYWLSGNQGQLSSFSVAVQDTTGAGDSFVAGFLHQLSQQGLPCLADPETAKRIVTYASAVGAMTTMKPGAIAAQPTAPEVEDFLRSQSDPPLAESHS